MSEKFSDKKSFYKKVALLGTGLIGGSIGMALRENNLVGNITCYDIDDVASRLAVDKGAADYRAESLSAAVRGAELIIIAVPVMTTPELLKEILPDLEKGVVITDVGSTKSSVMATAEQLLPGTATFIGGHPMAGSEESGINGADPVLLENAIYVLTPQEDTPKEIVDKLSDLFEAAGAQPIILDPLTHDTVVALISHLPHMTAAALVNSVAGKPDMELVRTLAAGGFRDSTRIALGNPDVWRDIFISNRWALLSALKAFKESLGTLEKYLTEPDAESVREYLLQARDYRKSIPHRGKGILPEIFELTVLVRDTPGIIGKVATLLGEAGINIDAIEIVHVRELAGGSVRLGFRSRDQHKKALDLLNERGYHTYSR
ncbi:MAG: prephenate dehydrogenase [Bacillota bacterium]|nr:prephenate dehydrogenase [Bacillota bacterium]